MKITKLGHCCLVIEENGVRILTDPGAYSKEQDREQGITAIVITHEHQDHFHLPSLKTVLAGNPQAVVITNSSVGKLLDAEGLAYEVVEDGDTTSLGGLLIAGFGREHAVIYQSKLLVQNTGYFIGDRLFYPGDCFHNPARPVEILALPVAGPWMKISEAIDYAKEIKPRSVFPVHDGMIRPEFRSGAYRITEAALASSAIKFLGVADGDSLLL